MSDIPWLRRINNVNNRTTLSPPSPSLQFVSLPSPPSTPRAFFKVSAIIPSWSSVLRRCHSRAGVAEPSTIVANQLLIMATRSKLLIVSLTIQLIALPSLPPPAKHLPTSHVAVDALATSRRHAGALSKAIATQNLLQTSTIR